MESNNGDSIAVGATLLDAVIVAYNKGYFKITDESGFGCCGVHCETPSNGFYFCEEDADSAKEYLKSVGEFEACKAIANTIEEMVEDYMLCDEAATYLMEMKDVCSVNGVCAMEDVIEEYLLKANKTFEENEEKYFE